MGQGRDNARQHLKDNPELMEEIENLIREKLMANPDAVPVQVADSDSTGD